MTPDLPELLDAASVVTLPMRVRFRGVTAREAVLLHGPSGWAEWAPFVEYDDADAARWLAAAVEAGWGRLPSPVRGAVGVNATVPAVPAEQVGSVLARYDVTRTAKIKVAERGQTLADDLARVTEVRRVLGPGARLRVDANGAWSQDDALEALRTLAPLGLEYAEQPCATVEELAALRVALARAGVDVPVAADESVRRAEDPLRVAREHAADLVVVKVAPLGGVARAVEIVQECGLPAVVSSALDTSVGLAVGVRLAAALPDLDHDCGLGTAALLAADVVADPLVPRAGGLTTDRADAAREAVDPALLTAHRSDPERETWWRERLTRAFAHLSGI
ncbi:o-succinylbenzoate synthase [Ornithinimicrobium humiphilum]|uniref:o-succinylbenzoate synthase n=1 Tax=Ornithinimicrobium humiphilum TaxID=125288 RepID=A0A543KKM2_9MICO|nr:o-succinylbenzoate synthase [Ornithinimicrobium humiphilum]TQM95616.1 O-succinylbenzoate synthase [Ornithinimicrobium humiphilum]